ncbi:class I SAM-dependent methyltransferase [Saccharopolyspora phatthalungensis]|uniref:Ubiquinone/menaquinone biosynthesis C-methylase UbiE n=1 Tax=Saccharopolyspora phatthalungensis TaxID=664693 RepID=A0A840QDB3_9PSEU|nr:class I SAM-dependent methyltransferase [Saccharopolyspora phatthalungensis]MBB5156445.1 ubiquinone/menaquinone biosynthesis C-methylase UbiE [Saccharopolyspora phatthalungensis]
MRATSKNLERLRHYWDKHSGSYDRTMDFLERNFFGDTREWLCQQARGEVLEVAVGTGLNLRWYPDDIRLSGIDFSPGMLGLARRRAEKSCRAVDLELGDAQRMDFPDSSFDTVVCTFSLCAIPDHRRAISEMHRVLRPGGRLLLADHVVSTSWLARVVQALLEIVTIPLGGEHFRRRPITHVRSVGFTIEQHDRFKLGIVERLVATKSTL